MHLIRILCAFNYIFNFCFILFLFFWTYSIAFLNCSKLFLSVHCYCCCCGKKGFFCAPMGQHLHTDGHTHTAALAHPHTHTCCAACAVAVHWCMKHLIELTARTHTRTHLFGCYISSATPCTPAFRSTPHHATPVWANRAHIAYRHRLLLRAIKKTKCHKFSTLFSSFTVRVSVCLGVSVCLCVCVVFMHIKLIEKRANRTWASFALVSLIELVKKANCPT